MVITTKLHSCSEHIFSGHFALNMALAAEFQEKGYQIMRNFRNRICDTLKNAHYKYNCFEKAAYISTSSL